MCSTPTRHLWLTKGDPGVRLGYVLPDQLWRGTAACPGYASYQMEQQQTCASLQSSLGCRSLINVCKHGHQPHISGDAGRLTNASTIRTYPGTKTESFDIYLTVAPSTEQAKYPIISMMVYFFVGFVFRRDEPLSKYLFSLSQYIARISISFCSSCDLKQGKNP